MRSQQQSCGNRLSTRLTLARRAEQQAVQLAKDVKTLTQWLSHDVLALAGLLCHTGKSYLTSSLPNSDAEKSTDVFAYVLLCKTTG